MPATGTDPDAALALWMQLHDSAFPAGRMVHSQGLEQWLAERPDADHDAVAAAVLAYLANSYAPLDATVCAASWRSAGDDTALTGLDALTASYKLFDNARTASESAGRQLASVSRQVGLADSRYLRAVTDGDTPGHCAVVEGSLQALLGIPMRVAVLGALRSTLASMLSAAIRLGRIGPLHSQRTQARSVALLVELAHQACARDVNEVWSVAPALEISGMRHETRSARLFTT